MPSTSVTLVIYEKEVESRWVSISVLNDRSQLDDVTSDGKLCQVLAAETGNAQSLIVECIVSGTSRTEVDD